MKTVIESISPFDILISPERQRKEFPQAAHEELKESIRTHGLFHAVGLRSKRDPTLVYGERRLRALRELVEENGCIRYNGKEYNGEIPFVIVPATLTDTDLMEIELHENISRLDLSWQDKARAIADLAELKRRRKEEAGEDTQADAPLPNARMPSLAELAVETKKTPATISTALTVARHLDDPDVAKAKSQKEALKIIDKKARKEYAEQRAKEFSKTTSRHTLIHGNCITAIAELPANTFAAVVTDPPYGIDMHKDLSWDGMTHHEYDDTEEYCLNLITNLLPEWARVTQAEAHLYIFCDWSKFETIKKLVEEHGVFEPMPYPFIWNKGNVASYPRADHWPRKSYECILYAIKGGKKQNKLDLAVIDIPQVQGHDHPAGKPAELYAHLINRSCLPGDKVLDCFAGCGTIFRAAKATSTTATGIELSDQYIALAKNTLADLGE